MPSRTAQVSTPLVPALCRLNENGALTELKLVQEEVDAVEPASDSHVTAIQGQLDEYFAGTRKQFSIALAPDGTGFQRRVWKELLRIPYGETLTYTELAARLDDTKAVRAVGGANGANPIWIVIPCHRVVGADGSLTGYAGGIEVKRYLLELEGAREPGLFSGVDERAQNR